LEFQGDVSIQTIDVLTLLCSPWYYHRGKLLVQGFFESFPCVLSFTCHR
jgi:hypothetical protein